MAHRSMLEELRLILADHNNNALVNRAYRLLLDREADPGGLAAYVEQLDNGLPAGEFLRNFRKSDEASRAAERIDPGRAMAFLAFEPCAHAVLPILTFRAEIEQEAMWRQIERLANQHAAYPDSEAAEVLLGTPIGWIDGLVDGAICGWVLQDSDAHAQIALNGVPIASVPCTVYRDDLAGASFGNAARGFRLPISDRDLSPGEMTLISVSINGGSLLPDDRFASEWLVTRIKALEHAGTRNAERLQIAAFRS